jgi:hypothetical protein
MNSLTNTLVNFNFWSIAKIFVLFGLGVYVIFAFIVVRQVKLMTEVISGMLTGALRTISWLFFLFSIFIFLVVLFFL